LHAVASPAPGLNDPDTGKPDIPVDIAQQMLMYADPGTSVEIVVSAFGSPDLCEPFEISGYHVSV
jgi:hypothetical protein